VLCDENCVQFFEAEVTNMSVSARGAIDGAALEKLIVDTGVSVNADDVDAVARSLDRIQSAAATLLQSLSFDETNERFYRLLDADFAEEVGR
jgi:hypothetical protein